MLDALSVQEVYVMSDLALIRELFDALQIWITKQLSGLAEESISFLSASLYGKFKLFWFVNGLGSLSGDMVPA